MSSEGRIPLSSAMLEQIVPYLQDLGLASTPDEEHDRLIIHLDNPLLQVVVRCAEDVPILYLGVLGLTPIENGSEPGERFLRLLDATYHAPAGGFARDARDGQVIFHISLLLDGADLTPQVLRRCMHLVRVGLGLEPACQETAETAPVMDGQPAPRRVGQPAPRRRGQSWSRVNWRADGHATLASVAVSAHAVARCGRPHNRGRSVRGRSA